jgi:hypothetical protein
MSTDLATRPRKRRDLPIDIKPIMVSHEVAAAMLAQISERKLDQLVAEGRIKARQVTPGRVGYLLRDLEAFVETLPEITPGLRPARAVRPAP